MRPPLRFRFLFRGAPERVIARSRRVSACSMVTICNRLTGANPGATQIHAPRAQSRIGFVGASRVSSTPIWAPCLAMTASRSRTMPTPRFAPPLTLTTARDSSLAPNRRTPSAPPSAPFSACGTKPSLPAAQISNSFLVGSLRLKNSRAASASIGVPIIWQSIPANAPYSRVPIRPMAKCVTSVPIRFRPSSSAAWKVVPQPQPQNGFGSVSPGLELALRMRSSKATGFRIGVPVS